VTGFEKEKLMNVKLRIIELLEEYDKGKYSNIILNDYFKKNKLSQGEKGFVTEVFYGVIRNLIFIDYQIGKRTKKIKKTWIKNLLRLSIYQGFFMDSDEKGVVWEAAELSKKKYGIQVSKFINGVLRNFFRDEETIAELEGKGRYDIIYSCPAWFYEKLKKEYPKNYLEVLKSYKATPKMSVRVNGLKYSEDEFKAFAKELGINILKQVGEVFYIDSGSILDTEEFKEGKLIVQDGSSYLAAKYLGAEPGETVLDACSAPGSKTAVLASTMRNKGKVYALDIHEHKLRLIEENMQKLGIHIVDTRLLDARDVHNLKVEFDRVLVDAPCSGYGVLRKKPEAIYNKDMSNVEELARLQYSILEACSDNLKPGGVLVYSTCTIFREENTDNVKRFLEGHSEFSVMEIEKPGNVEGHFDELGGLVIDYREPYLDGFYIIKMRKKQAEEIC